MEKFSNKYCWEHYQTDTFETLKIGLYLDNSSWLKWCHLYTCFREIFPFEFQQLCPTAHVHFSNYIQLHMHILGPVKHLKWMYLPELLTTLQEGSWLVNEMFHNLCVNKSTLTLSKYSITSTVFFTIAFGIHNFFHKGKYARRENHLNAPNRHLGRQLHRPTVS